MPRVPAPEVSEALELLVRQFSQPLAFLRELVQNALDAGTNRVDVAVSHDSESGCAVVEVADTGEGMDRAIIDGQLTRLFSSAKEGDLTKIGKFGIGFVSVFAIGPKAVVVDTARGGEAWRVLFHPDRTFDRIVLDEPLEGTRVRVFVPLNPTRLDRFRRDCEATVRYWCKHCEVEIRFDGVAVNEEFALPGGFQVRHAVPGTEVVLAPSADPQPLFGFYNRGLTLVEGPGSPLPGVAFKVRSRYLEHTLTRDNVLRDAHFEKAMGLVREVARRHMPRRLLEALQGQPEALHWEAAAMVLAGPDLPREFLRAKLFPLLDGSRQSLQDLREGPAPCWAATPDELARAAAAEGERVLVARHDAPVLAALRAGGVQPESLAGRWHKPREVPVPPALEPLLAEFRPFLGDLGLDDVRCVAAEASLPAAWRVRDPGRARRLADREGRVLALQPDRPLVLSCQRLALHDVNLAASLLARGVALELQVGPSVAAGLLARAVQRRREAPPASRPDARKRGGRRR